MTYLWDFQPTYTGVTNNIIKTWRSFQNLRTFSCWSETVRSGKKICEFWCELRHLMSFALVNPIASVGLAFLPTIHGYGMGILKRFALSEFWDLLSKGSITWRHPYFSLQTIHTKPSSNPWDNNGLPPQKKPTQYEISNWHWLVLYVTVSLFLLAIPVPCKHTSVIINYSLFRNHAPLITSQ